MLPNYRKKALKLRQILRCVLHAFGFDRLTNLCAAECSITVLCQLVENGNGQWLFFFSNVNAITQKRVMNFVYWCYEFCLYCQFLWEWAESVLWKIKENCNTALIGNHATSNVKISKQTKRQKCKEAYASYAKMVLVHAHCFQLLSAKIQVTFRGQIIQSQTIALQLSLNLKHCKACTLPFSLPFFGGGRRASCWTDPGWCLFSPNRPLRHP